MARQTALRHSGFGFLSSFVISTTSSGRISKRPNSSAGSFPAAAFNHFDRLLERSLIHAHEVPGLGKTAALHVPGIFAKGRNAFVLESLEFFAKIPVSLGMAWNALVVVLKNVVGEEELCVAAGAGTERHQDHGSFPTEIARQVVRHQFELRRISAG